MQDTAPKNNPIPFKWDDPCDDCSHWFLPK